MEETDDEADDETEDEEPEYEVEKIVASRTKVLPTNVEINAFLFEDEQLMFVREGRQSTSSNGSDGMMLTTHGNPKSIWRSN